MKCYRCNTGYDGKEFIIKEGGFFEKIDSLGHPVKIGHDFKGYKQSETPQACFSKSPEASLFASLQGSENLDDRHIYYCNIDPDCDLSDSISGDFSALEEVRINNPEDNPIKLKYYKKVEIPNIALKEVNLCYTDYGKFIHRLAEDVKKELRNLIENNNYEQSLEDGWHTN